MISPWLYFGGAIVVALCGMVLLSWALLADRARRRRRCPHCWYHMEPVTSLSHRCPECGHRVNSEQEFYRTRRRWKWAIIGLVVIILAVALSVQPHAQRNGYGSLLPATVLIGLLQFDDSGWIVRGIDYHCQRNMFHRSVAADPRNTVDPRTANALWQWQWRWLGHTVLRRVNERNPAHWRFLAWSRDFAGDPVLRDDISDRFAAGLAHSDPYVRGLTAVFATDLDDLEATIGRLRPMLNDDHPAARHGAIMGLRSVAMSNRSALNELFDALNHEYPDVRASAAMSLGELSERYTNVPEVREALFAMVEDPNCKVRETQIQLIVKLQDGADEWDTIEAAMRSADDCIRRGGFIAARSRGGRPEPRIGHPPPSVVPILIAALDDHDDDIREYASELLSDHRFDREMLIPHLDRFEALAEHRDPIVQQTASAIIKRLHD